MKSPDQDRTTLSQEGVQPTRPLPKGFVDYVTEKVEKNGKGGRPHFLQELSKRVDPQDEMLNILDLVWLRNKNLRNLATKYDTSYFTLYRVIQDLEPFKDEIVEFLIETPRRKRFFNKTLETSDYETVRTYIKRAKRPPRPLKTWKRTIRLARKAWVAFKYKDPTSWISDDVVVYLETLPDSQKKKTLTAIRAVAPQIGEGGADEVSVSPYSDLEGRRKVDLFGKETKFIIKALKKRSMKKHETVFKLHVAVAFREGSKREDCGMSFCNWSHFKSGFIMVDDYETKVKGLIVWRDCPTDFLFSDLPELLKEMWIEQGKPTDQRILGEKKPYAHLLQIYKEIRAVLKEEYEGKLEPRLFKQLTSLRPHDADKIHCNLLWEAEVPLEILAGEYLKGGEGIGLVGRGWLSLDTIKKHYLSLTQRSKRFKKLKRKVERYSQLFD